MSELYVEAKLAILFSTIHIYKKRDNPQCAVKKFKEWKQVSLTLFGAGFLSIKYDMECRINHAQYFLKYLSISLKTCTVANQRINPLTVNVPII